MRTKNLDVFISHSSKDAYAANAIKEHLRAAGMRCWKAPDDIRPGESWPQAIARALADSHAMVLVWSANSTQSPEVSKELTLAMQNNVTVIPLRLEEVQPNGEWAYHLANTHWMDAYPGILESHLDALAKYLECVLAERGPSASRDGGTGGALSDLDMYDAGAPVSRRAPAPPEHAAELYYSDRKVSPKDLADIKQRQRENEAAELDLKTKIRDAKKLIFSAEILLAKADYAAAEPLYRQALELSERALGDEHPDTVAMRNKVAELLSSSAELLLAKADYAAAEPLYRQALEMSERALGHGNPDTVARRNKLAELLKTKGDYDAAELLYRQALDDKENALGPRHPDTATAMTNLALLLCSKGEYDVAEMLHERALKIRETAFGPRHRLTAITLSNLADVLLSKGNYHAAEPLQRRALDICENTLGPNHLDTAATLDKLAALLESKGDHAEAEQLLRRSLSIRESALEPQHPQTAKSLESLGELLPVTQKAPSAYSAAVPLYRRALTIFQNSLGPAHPDTVPLEEKLHLVEKQRRLFWLSGLVIFLFIAAGCLALGHHLGLL